MVRHALKKMWKELQAEEQLYIYNYVKIMCVYVHTHIYMSKTWMYINKRKSLENEKMKLNKELDRLIVKVENDKPC